MYYFIISMISYLCDYMFSLFMLVNIVMKIEKFCFYRYYFIV